MADNEILTHQGISRCPVHACNGRFHWFLRLNRKWFPHVYQCSAPKNCLRLKQQVING